MSNRISDIEAKIIENLLAIDGSAASAQYTYHSNTGTVQVYDEALSIAQNRASVDDTDKAVNHILEQQEDIGVEAQDWSTGQKAYTNRVVYIIESKVHNSLVTENPINEIRTLMGDLLSDLLYQFGLDNTLGGQVNWIRFAGGYRDYDPTNNRIQSAKLISSWEVVFNQSFDNPDTNACW